MSCLEDRSSRPLARRGCCRRSSSARICAARRRIGLGPRLIAGETGHPHATVWRALRRAGISRPPQQPREQPRRYEWPCPGDLLHIDSKRFVRFSRPGHAVTGDRHRSGAEKRMRVGYRVGALARRRPLPLRLQRAPPRRACRTPSPASSSAASPTSPSYGIEPKRLMCDNAFVYRHNRSLARAPRPPRDPPPASSRPAGRRSTGKSSATSRRSSANGDSATSTAPATTAHRRCHTGSATTTSADHTARSAAGHHQPRPQRPEAGHLRKFGKAAI